MPTEMDFMKKRKRKLERRQQKNVMNSKLDHLPMMCLESMYLTTL